MRPEGDNTGSGIKNQLGRPDRLGEYAILVREAVQNSWDARRIGADVRFSISLRTLGGFAPAWRRHLGSSTLPTEQSSVLTNLSGQTPVLIVSDRGTSGLGGPLRSDRSNTSGEIANFVQFMRNVGEARDSDLGGGTYGYGKGIFYRISSASAILVDSKNGTGGQAHRRLMGAALSDAFDSHDGRRFTGRHWWGVVNDGVPDPVLDQAATSLSAELGLPGFEENDTGTDIVIVAPDIHLESGDDDLESLGERIRGHIYWHLWPKFATAQRPHGIRFNVFVEEQALDFPDVSTVPVIRNLAKSLDDIARRQGADYELKKYLPNSLGEFAVDYVIKAPAPMRNSSIISIMSYADIEPPYRHVARMRQAELVVDYFKAAPMPTTDIGYVGAFRSSAFADEAFAAAEPPTHDAWSTAGLTGNNLGIVRGAKSFLENETNALVAARTGARSKLVQGLGKISNELGNFLAPVIEPSGPSESSTTRPSRSGRKTNKPFKDLGQQPIRLERGKPYVGHLIQVGDSVAIDSRLEATAFIKLANGGRELPDSAPVGSDQPRFRGWYLAEGGDLLTTDYRLSLENLAGLMIEARFEHVAGAAIKTYVEGKNV